MTKAEAKQLSLEVWQWLVKHPEAPSKASLPSYIYAKIGGLEHCCPLCEVYGSGNHKFRCHECPLGTALGACWSDESVYSVWANAEDRDIRQEAAQKIVRVLEMWRVEE